MESRLGIYYKSLISYEITHNFFGIRVDNSTSKLVHCTT